MEKQLDQLATAVRDGSTRDVDDQIWLTRFLIIRACGYLERVVHETVVGHLQERSYGTARSFVMSWLDRSSNPSCENLLKILGRLDSGMQIELQEIFDADNKRLSQKVALLVGRRNQIAHGENEGLNSQTALELVSVSKEIADWFILRLDPTNPPSRKIR